MTQPSDHAIIRDLWPLGPDADPQQRVDATYRAYSEMTGDVVPSPLTPCFQRKVRDWLHAQDDAMPVYNELGHSIALLHQKVQRTKPLIQPDVASKANWLQQAPCLSCLYDEASPVSPVFFPLRVRPFSPQSMRSSNLKRLKQLISESMEGRLTTSGDWTGVSVCFNVVAVVGAGQRLKDVDNMVKGLLDALQGHLYLNDDQIAHLSVHRLRHGGDDGFYLMSARPVLNPLADVIDHELRLGWAGRPEISLD